MSSLETFVEKFDPDTDTALVQLDDFQEKSAGGIYMPEKHQEQNRIGTVLKCGRLSPYLRESGRRQYEPGDRVIVSFYTGVVLHIVKYNIGIGKQDRTRLINVSEILGKIEE